MTELSPTQLKALRNLARKHAGDEVDWISIADARALTALGLAARNPGGWHISAEGIVALAAADAAEGSPRSGEPDEPAAR